MNLKLGTNIPRANMPLTIMDSTDQGNVTYHLATDAAGRWYLIEGYTWNTYNTVVGVYKGEAAARRAFKGQVAA